MKISLYNPSDPNQTSISRPLNTYTRAGPTDRNPVSAPSSNQRFYLAISLGTLRFVSTANIHCTHMVTSGGDDDTTKASALPLLLPRYVVSIYRSPATIVSLPLRGSYTTRQCLRRRRTDHSVVSRSAILRGNRRILRALSQSLSLYSVTGERPERRTRDDDLRSTIIQTIQARLHIHTHI